MTTQLTSGFSPLPDPNGLPFTSKPLEAAELPPSVEETSKVPLISAPPGNEDAVSTVSVSDTPTSMSYEAMPSLLASRGINFLSLNPSIIPPTVETLPLASDEGELLESEKNKKGPTFRYSFSDDEAFRSIWNNASVERYQLGKRMNGIQNKNSAEYKKLEQARQNLLDRMRLLDRAIQDTNLTNRQKNERAFELFLPDRSSQDYQTIPTSSLGEFLKLSAQDQAKRIDDTIKDNEEYIYQYYRQFSNAESELALLNNPRSTFGQDMSTTEKEARIKELTEIISKPKDQGLTLALRRRELYNKIKQSGIQGLTFREYSEVEIIFNNRYGVQTVRWDDQINVFSANMYGSSLRGKTVSDALKSIDKFDYNVAQAYQSVANGKRDLYLSSDKMKPEYLDLYTTFSKGPARRDDPPQEDAVYIVQSEEDENGALKNRKEEELDPLIKTLKAADKSVSFSTFKSIDGIKAVLNTISQTMTRGKTVTLYISAHGGSEVGDFKRGLPNSLLGLPGSEAGTISGIDSNELHKLLNTFCQVTGIKLNLIVECCHSGQVLINAEEPSDSNEQYLVSAEPPPDSETQFVSADVEGSTETNNNTSVGSEDSTPVTPQTADVQLEIPVASTTVSSTTVEVATLMPPGENSVLMQPSTGLLHTLMNQFAWLSNPMSDETTEVSPATATTTETVPETPGIALPPETSI